MTTLVKKRKLAAVARKKQEGFPRNSQSGNSAIPRVIQDLISQVSVKGDRGQGNEEVPSGVQLDREPNSGCSF